MTDSSPFKSIPDPLLPEHQLLKQAGDLPVLSSELRNRVVLNIHRQARFGRWMDRLRVLASAAAVLLLVFGAWSLRDTPAERPLESQSAPAAGQSLDQLDHSVAPSAGSMHAASPSAPDDFRNSEKTGGGGGSQPLQQNLNELQQINRLIEHYQQRKTTLCSLLLH